MVSFSDLIQKLSVVALIFEVLYRVVIAIMNIIRMTFDSKHRSDILEGT